MADAGCHSCKKLIAAGAEKQCGGCRSVYYCNADCQRTAWALHKGICKGLRKLRDEHKAVRRRGGGGGSLQTDQKALYEWFGSIKGLALKVMCLAGVYTRPPVGST